MIDQVVDGFIYVVKMRDGGLWRCCLQPGEFVRATGVLPTEELAVLSTIWTPEVIAAFVASLPSLLDPLPTFDFGGAPVANAAAVDRVTAARISALVAPGLTGDVALLRQLSVLRTSISLIRKDATGKANETDQKTLAELEALDAQVDAIIAEGDAFKQAHGW